MGRKVTTAQRDTFRSELREGYTVEAVAVRHAVTPQTVKAHAGYEVGGRCLLVGTEVYIEGSAAGGRSAATSAPARRRAARDVHQRPHRPVPYLPHRADQPRAPELIARRSEVCNRGELPAEAEPLQTESDDVGDAGAAGAGVLVALVVAARAGVVLVGAPPAGGVGAAGTHRNLLWSFRCYQSSL
jgi:hypothetical protein